ncbi:MAG: hypothetical protein AAF529_08445 [Pseudomonadota bacterium]
MNKAPFTTSLILAGMVAAGAAQANPYASWQSTVSDDDQVTIEDSFKSEYTSSYSEDNDQRLDVRKSHSEDNDLTVGYRTHEERSEDNDITRSWSNVEDNDVTKSWSNSEDNDHTYSEDNDVAVDVDFQIATPTLESYKMQSQDAGHAGSQTVLGSASGHEVGVQGGTNVVSAGNDEQTFFGPAMVNTNINQLPVNNTFVGGDNYAPISQANTFAGRDMGPKGVFAPIGNTHAEVLGNVGQSSNAGMSQSGSSANGIADTMSAPISK